MQINEFCDAQRKPDNAEDETDTGMDKTTQVGHIHWASCFATIKHPRVKETRYLSKSADISAPSENKP